MKSSALFLIKAYRFISKGLPARCRFEPSCSLYAYEAIEKFGIFKGVFLSLIRILRCNPFCKGGYDPVPQKNLKK
ncbi:MAG: membrane protein insertion efficiency factor YidD [Elusimicrobiota bacterium]|jgi:putative membrane protein insertion efficiency factor|nr:membrane protein insertion efficiency factor YidD [Elusimicrobiota bacterium]